MDILEKNEGEESAEQSYPTSPGSIGSCDDEFILLIKKTTISYRSYLLPVWNEVGQIFELLYINMVKYLFFLLAVSSAVSLPQLKKCPIASDEPSIVDSDIMTEIENEQGPVCQIQNNYYG